MSSQLFLLEIALGLLIGLLLGLLGGGGSILTVPALVYLVGQSPQVAVTTSLMIVGANSASGAFLHGTRGTLNGRVALLFGGVGMASAYLAAGFSERFSSQTLMLMFASLMLVVGVLMLTRKPTPQEESAEAHPPRWGLVVLTGLLVGVVTGFLGVGGGFLIVPALVLGVGLPMKQAVGTSLVVIVMNSLAAFLGHLSHLNPDWDSLAVFVSAGIIGTLAGVKLSARIQPDNLRKLFALFVLALALFLLVDNLLI